MAQNSLFATKSVAQLLAQGADEGEHSLKRALGRWSLVAIGIGAIIGAGIFVMTGIGAHGSLNEDGTVKILGAGPALALSFVLAGIACVFAALCYAEFASMVPVAGSAYTYAYATLGELFAWIIGWDLVLEYMMGAATVSVGWSGYCVKFLKLFGIHLPEWMTNDWITYSRGATAALTSGHPWPAPPTIAGIPIVFNLLAFGAVLLVTAVLARGIQESARLNAGIVATKTAVVVMVIIVGAFYVKAVNWGTSWSDFAPNGFAGIASGAAIIFFAYIGFDAISTAAEETKNPQKDMPFGIIGSLIVCTILYIAVALVLTGMVHWSKIDLKARSRRRSRATGSVGCLPHHGRRARGRASVMRISSARRVFRHVARRSCRDRVRRGPHEVPDAVQDDVDRRMRLRPSGRLHSDRRPRPDGEHRHASRVRHRVRGRHHPAAHEPGREPAVPHAVRARRPDPRRDLLPLSHAEPRLAHVGPSRDLARDRPRDFFRLQPQALAPDVGKPALT